MPRLRLSLRARAASWAMEMPPLSSMVSGKPETNAAFSPNRRNSSSLSWPRMARSTGSPARAQMILVATCSLDISSE